MPTTVSIKLIRSLVERTTETEKRNRSCNDMCLYRHRRFFPRLLLPTDIHEVEVGGGLMMLFHSLVNYAVRGCLHGVVVVVAPKNKIARSPLNAHRFSVRYFVRSALAR